MGAQQNPAGNFFQRLFGGNAAQPDPIQSQMPSQMPQPQGQMQQQQQQINPAQFNMPIGSQAPDPNGNNPNSGQPQQQQLPQNGQNQNQQQQQQQSPVDALNSLLNNPNQNQTQAAPDFFAISPEQLQQISGRAAYSATLPGQLMQEFSQDPVATLPKILDHVTTSMMRDVVPLVSKMTQAGTNHIGNQLRTELPQSIGRQQAVSSIVQQNPMMQPFADMIVSRMQQQNPGMSAAEIQGQAGKLLQNFMDFAVSNHQQQQQTQQSSQQQAAKQSNAETIDWDTLF